MAPTIFFHIFRIFFLNNFIKNPQTRNARAFLPLNISDVGSVAVFATRPTYVPLFMTLKILQCSCRAVPDAAGEYKRKNMT